MILQLTRFKNSIWKQKFKEIPSITPEIKELVKNMQETLELTSGVGLAAPQVGQTDKLFIIHYSRLREVFINPKITSYSKEKNEIEEGCLSIPCVRGAVSRANEIDIEYTDLKGRRKQAKLTGYYARIAQHEYDHLSSTFYRDHIKDKKKIYTYKPIRLIFFGTPDFGAIILKSLIGQQLAGEYEIPLVVTTADKKSGRGQEMTSTPVKHLAEEFKIPVSTKSVDQKLIAEIKKLKPDFIVLASYGKILPKEVLAIPTKAPLNVHPSLLPKYRGASPIQTSILKGDQHTGVTIMKMNAKMDEGDILAAAKVKISPKDSYDSLSPKLASIGAMLTHQVLHLLNVGKLKSLPQEHKKATYTKILKKEDGQINWKKPPKNLENMIRAYHPWPGVWTKYNDKILKLLPNKMVQLEGKNPVKLVEFKRGYSDFTLQI